MRIMLPVKIAAGCITLAAIVPLFEFDARHKNTVASCEPTPTESPKPKPKPTRTPSLT